MMYTATRFTGTGIQPLMDRKRAVQPAQATAATQALSKSAQQEALQVFLTSPLLPPVAGETHFITGQQFLAMLPSIHGEAHCSSGSPSFRLRTVFATTFDEALAQVCEPSDLPLVRQALARIEQFKLAIPQRGEMTGGKGHAQVVQYELSPLGKFCLTQP